FGAPPCGTSSGFSTPSPCSGVPFQSMDNWMDMARSSLDFLLGADNPWREHLNRNRIGIAGHSLGAKAASYVQDPAYDEGQTSGPRVRAVVAIDNLSSDYYGDPSAAGGGTAENGVV